MRRINLSRQAAKFLRQVPPKHGRQLAAKISQLATDPEPPDSALLKGYPYRRADSGEYRIIYEHDSVELRVLIVGKRNDDEVYRLLRRK
jgi:mRNA interferase RelE/StbE